jgi:F-type H+-transporting ATPase subunit gamma
MEASGPANEAFVADETFDVTEYLFEPSANEVLEAMLIRLVESQLYQALLDASASEHAARMLAMRNATDAATDLIDELTLEFNKARQAGITKDLAEISASKIALAS